MHGVNALLPWRRTRPVLPSLLRSSLCTRLTNETMNVHVEQIRAERRQVGHSDMHHDMMHNTSKFLLLARRQRFPIRCKPIFAASTVFFALIGVPSSLVVGHRLDAQNEDSLHGHSPLQYVLPASDSNTRTYEQQCRHYNALIITFCTFAVVLFVAKHARSVCVRAATIMTVQRGEFVPHFVQCVFFSGVHSHRTRQRRFSRHGE